MKNMNKRKEKEIELKGRIKDFAKELATLTDKAKFSDTLKNYFDFLSKFHKYSWNNQILIYSQKPYASFVCGFRKWSKEFKRNIKAGESAIWIFAPRFYKEKEEVMYKNKETGEYELKEEEIEHIYFVPVPVFDVSQTQGEELPTIDYHTKTNNHKKVLEQLETLCKSENITLEYKPLRQGLNGYSANKNIVINKNLSIDDQATTLMHELAHETLHWDTDRGKYTTKQKETEAEATAYIICRFLNIESKAFNYLALYNSDSELILNSLERISKAVNKILKYFNNEIKTKKENEVTVTVTH